MIVANYLLIVLRFKFSLNNTRILTQKVQIYLTTYSKNQFYQFDFLFMKNYFNNMCEDLINEIFGYELWGSGEIKHLIINYFISF